ncbi:hypothetical protein [Curtobacterium sp. MCBD17_040]|uniref:hypothetical protein n=1 Tax=Curtobacterium sp. MCBD17_040 TaxID=2175674 RepID=UPI000DAA7D78|nr:hypothetical protein [Curtobacterium sp. MCBD17_040]WIB65373.1 hypothetical protein DEI94_18370 [Curtobacterium sp. MCBD17_040]
MNASANDPIRDDYDLAVALAVALRIAKHAGDIRWERELHATLLQTVHTLGLSIPDDEEMPATIVTTNGSFDTERLHTLLRLDSGSSPASGLGALQREVDVRRDEEAAQGARALSLAQEFATWAKAHSVTPTPLFKREQEEVGWERDIRYFPGSEVLAEGWVLELEVNGRAQTLMVTTDGTRVLHSDYTNGARTVTTPPPPTQSFETGWSESRVAGLREGMLAFMRRHAEA